MNKRTLDLATKAAKAANGMNGFEEADIRRVIISAFGDKPRQLKKALKVLEKMIQEMQEEHEERLANYYMGRGPHP